MMRNLMNLLALVLIIGGLAYHFAALKIFNALVPKDAGTTRVAQSVPYGPDPRQRLDVYAPAGAKGPLPILFFVNGGSWNDGARGDYEFAGRAFAAGGYLTLAMDYRLMPENPFPSFVQDIAIAMAWAQNHGAEFGGDPRRMFAVGHSAGAYNALMLALDARFLRDAAFGAPHDAFLTQKLRAAGFIIVGLCAIPYLDTNPKGNGYYTFDERPFAVSFFWVGFILFWVSFVILGTFLRGPNWSFFGPFEYWDLHKLEPMVNVDLSTMFWVNLLDRPRPDNPWLREAPGISLVLGYFLLLPPILGKSVMRSTVARLGMLRYNVFVHLFLWFALVPIKMGLRWTVNLKYFVGLPEFFFNI